MTFNNKAACLLLSASIIIFGGGIADASTGYGGYTGGGSSAPYISNPLLVEPIKTTPVQPVSAPSFVFQKDLKRGQTSVAVIILQQRLREEGFFTYPVSTGFFGPITVQAVKKFQAAHPEIGLVTGFVGPLTRAVLNQ